MSRRATPRPRSQPEHVETVAVRAASVTYGTVQALAPITFTVDPGQCVAAVGHNGSGKSTLLALVAGRAAPTSGEVLLWGQPAAQARRTAAADLSVLLGPFASYRDLTVREHLAIVAASWPAVAANGSVQEVLARTGLSVVQHQLPGELSSGEAQMFSLACATMRPARLLVLDEPEQRLDAERRARTAQLLLAAKKRGAAVVLATHDAGLREAVADEVVHLHGRATGSIEPTDGAERPVSYR